MTQTGSVTAWIADLKTGDARSSQAIWERYIERLIRFARSRLASTPRREIDEEDVVLAAFDAFFRGVAESRFPQMTDRHDLWQVLVMLTDRNAIDIRRRQLAAKRGGGHVRGESAFETSPEESSCRAGLSQVADLEPTPEFALQFAEDVERRLSSLGDETLRGVAIAKLEGWTNTEVAEQLQVTTRSVERKLRMIRKIWDQEDSS